MKRAKILTIRDVVKLQLSISAGRGAVGGGLESFKLLTPSGKLLATIEPGIKCGSPTLILIPGEARQTDPILLALMGTDVNSVVTGSAHISARPCFD